MSYISERRKSCSFNKYCLSIDFQRDINEGNLSLEHSHDKQTIFSVKLKNLGKGRKTIEKELSKITRDYYLVPDKKFLITSKTDFFKEKSSINIQHLNQHVNQNQRYLSNQVNTRNLI